MVLARRLFWDPRGPVVLYPQFRASIGEPMRVSWSQDIEDPDEPGRLVNRLENSLLGCAWMLDRWGDLRDLIVDGHKWQAPDRFMAIRLLGKQPLDPIHHEQVRAVYLCCKAIDPEGVHEYNDIANELHAAESERFIERNDEREILKQTPTDAESARAVLLELIDGRMERLEVLLKRHQERDEAAGVDRFGFDDTKEGEQLRSYQLGGNRALMRILDTFLKYRRETERAASEEGGTQRPGTSRRAGADGGPQVVSAPTELPPGRTEMIPPVSEDPAPRIDDPSPADAAGFPPPVATVPVHRAGSGGCCPSKPAARRSKCDERTQEPGRRGPPPDRDDHPHPAGPARRSRPHGGLRRLGEGRRDEPATAEAGRRSEIPSAIDEGGLVDRLSFARCHDFRPFHVSPIDGRAP